MKRIAVLTSGRQDWGIIRSTCLALRDDARFDLRLLVGGMHCVAAYGQTERLIEADGFEVAERLDWIGNASDTADEAGRALAEVGAALARQVPEALLLVGDRFETAAAAMAATIEGVPLVHVHGGEETGGAFDDAFRHAITKLSHLHLVSHADHGLRVAQLGEDPSTIHVVGAPGLDNLSRDDLPGRDELQDHLGIPLEPPVVVVTVQPTTLRADHETDEVGSVMAAMEEVPATYVVTLPNNDPGHEGIRSALLAGAGQHDRWVAVEALGERRYWGLLRHADAMLGNSSSGLIEGSALGLPAVNVGDRQLGRLRGMNVIDSPPESGAIAAALNLALAPATRTALAGSASPYGHSGAAARIVQILAVWTPPSPPRKAPVALGQERPGAMGRDTVDLVLLGGGEHARVVLDAARSQGRWRVVGFVDPKVSPAMVGLGVPWLGVDEATEASIPSRAAILAVGGLGGDIHREAIISRHASSEINWATVVHRSAVVAADVTLAPGAVVLARAVVNPGARIGAHAIVNSGAVVEHDVEIGAFGHVGPGAVIGGGAMIGTGAAIGLGARVRDHVRVGDRAVVGMGAVVIEDVPPGAVVAGVPARSVRSGDRPVP